MRRTTTANLILIGVSAMWGLTFPLIHNAVAYISPGLFVAMRMCIATLVLFPFAIGHFRKINRRLAIGCLALAFLNTATYLFQSQGLTTIPASRSAFITGICVVIVPLLMPLFKLGKPDKIVYISVIICLIGLYILTGANLRHLTIGDLWTFACAVTYALFIVIMQIMSQRTKDHFLLCFLQIFFCVPFALPFAGKILWPVIFHPAVIVGLLFCALFATSLSIYLQGRYQQYTTAAKAALIFSLEPVFATLFAYMINHSQITDHIIVGGGCILLSIILRDLIQLFRQRTF